MSTLENSWPDRRPVHRDDDGELLGYVVPVAGGAVPTTVFGAPLGGAAPADEAADLVVATGLSPLADAWVLARDEGDLRVRIVEAAPDRVVVQNDDVASGLDLQARFTVVTPVAGVLRREG